MHGFFWEYSSRQRRTQTETEISSENMAHMFSVWSLVPKATGRNAAPCFISNKFPGYSLSAYCRREAVHTSAQSRILSLLNILPLKATQPVSSKRSGAEIGQENVCCTNMGTCVQIHIYHLKPGAMAYLSNSSTRELGRQVDRSPNTLLGNITLP